MIRLDKGSLEIDIKLDNGIYIMGYNSGEGKTYLAKCISSITSRKDFICLSYNNFSYVSSLYELAENRRASLIILDRYDMYNGTFADDILRLKDKAIILIDSKQVTEFEDQSEICKIRLGKNNIEVSL
jgi:hypothetical protein